MRLFKILIGRKHLLGKADGPDEIGAYPSTCQTPSILTWGGGVYPADMLDT